MYAYGKTRVLEQSWKYLMLKEHGIDFILKLKITVLNLTKLWHMLKKKLLNLIKAIETSTLKEKIDVDFVNDLLIDIRKQQLKSII